MMAQTAQDLGDVQFIINVGDAFYPNGVASKSDPQWDAAWRNAYSPLLRTVPWYSIYGNADYHQDPCACSDDPRACALVNANLSDLNQFYMPDLNWFKEHEDLGVEVIGLDLNHFMW